MFESVSGWRLAALTAILLILRLASFWLMSASHFKILSTTLLVIGFVLLAIKGLLGLRNS